MKNPCSLRQLAKHLGLAPSTVSMAMNGHPSVAQKTKLRVAQAAERFGYRPNPAFSALMARNDTDKKRQARGLPVALLVDIPPEWKSKNLREDTYLHICKAHADRFGFEVRMFNLADYASPAELDRILYARGYRAILLGYWFEAVPRILEMKLERYAVVGLGDLACDLPMLSIRVNIVESIRMVWNRLKAIEAERVLFAVRLEPQPGRKDYEMVGALKALQTLEKSPWKTHIHIGRQNDREAALFRKAVADWQPDVCVGYNRFHYDELYAMNRKIPGELRYVQLHVAPHHDYRPDGIRAPHEATTLRGLIEIHRMLRTGTLGIDPAMGEILLEPEWVEGTTLIK